MSKAHPGKFFAIGFMLFIAAVGGAGYYSFSNKGDDAPVVENSPLQQPTAPDSVAATASADAKAPEAPADATPAGDITAAQADDVVYGKNDAPVTIIDYSSLSCPHCAHFHNEVLPDLQKEFIEKGKAKLVFRHFPLNEPALRAAELVNCASALQKQNLIKALFDKQGDWGFTESFLKELKPIAAAAGIDAATFDSCVANKAGEDRILDVRKLAATVGKVNSTPSFFVNGAPLGDTPTIGHFRDAIANTGK